MSNIQSCSNYNIINTKVSFTKNIPNKLSPLLFEASEAINLSILHLEDYKAFLSEDMVIVMQENINWMMDVVKEIENNLK